MFCAKCRIRTAFSGWKPDALPIKLHFAQVAFQDAHNLEAWKALLFWCPMYIEGIPKDSQD